MAEERAIVKKYVDNSTIRESFLEVYNVEQLLKYDFTFKLYERRTVAKNVNVPEKFQHYFKDEIPHNDFNLYHKSSRYAMYVEKLIMLKCVKYYRNMSVSQWIILKQK